MGFKEVPGVNGNIQDGKVFEKTEKNVDNRIQYVGQIESEGKHS